jgi:TonB-dependent SusC/RagA subfamily outer membrane receptor
MALPAYSQTRVLKGKITTFNRYPVQNVKVASKKTKSAVMTDSLGQFELVCSEKDVIMIKTKVFNPFNKRVTPGDDYVSANLVFNDSNVFSLIGTNVPEVQVISGAGGAAKGVYIREQKSMNSEMNNEAVYEVDGMIVTDLTVVNPCDIASIDILKSGGTAVYGTQAVNGVVVIKTKGNRIQTRDR